MQNKSVRGNDPEVSVVICTRNRGKGIQATIQTVLASQHSNFELIVVDQSTDDVTEKTIQPFIDDIRFRYIRSNTTGVGISRNIGLQNARADIIAYTDDDCTVSTNWLNAVEDVLLKYPQVAVVFCSVDPGPHDPHAGTIPNRHYTQDKIYRSIIQYFNTYGMGAGMGLRKSSVLKWGGFDETLGPGASFRSGEDFDIALRALLNYKWVYELSSESVTHHGFRSQVEYREITKRDYYAIGAVHSKLAKRSLKEALPTILYYSLYLSLWMPMAMLFSFKRPRGLIRFVYYWLGFFKGMHTPVDHSNLIYLYRS
jgi:glycosyltransferase involved in cell wall biosynthesis